MSAFVVSLAAPHELLPACRLLFAKHTDGDERAEHYRERLLAEGEAAGVFVARNTEGKLRAATLVQALPGALGLSWAPKGDSSAAEDAVTVAACAWLRERGVKVCQAFASADEVTEMASLERNGFRHVTQLVFLSREVDRERDRFATPTPPARCSPCGRELTQEQSRLLLATHEGTLDCPELNAPRTPAEILDGFRPDNPTTCSWCYTIDESDQLIGVLLFDQSSQDRAVELSYLGLIPSARGRGLGGTLLRFAERVAIDAGYRSLTVSVDARNTPAMKLYTRHGFVEYERREVWLASWAG